MKIRISSTEHSKYAFLGFGNLKRFLESKTSQIAQTAITKYHRMGGLNNRSLFLTILEARQSKFRVASLVSFWWGLSSYLANGCFFPVSSHVRGSKLSVSLIRALIPSGQGLTSVTHFTLITSQRSHLQIPLYWESFNIWIWGGAQTFSSCLS